MRESYSIFRATVAQGHAFLHRIWELLPRITSRRTDQARDGINLVLLATFSLRYIGRTKFRSYLQASSWWIGLVWVTWHRINNLASVPNWRRTCGIASPIYRVGRNSNCKTARVSSITFIIRLPWNNYPTFLTARCCSAANFGGIIRNSRNWLVMSGRPFRNIHDLLLIVRTTCCARFARINPRRKGIGVWWNRNIHSTRRTFGIE